MGTKVGAHNCDVIEAFVLEISKNDLLVIDSAGNLQCFELYREFTAPFLPLLWPFEVDKKFAAFLLELKKILGNKGLTIV